jgi:hypothetical protein
MKGLKMTNKEKAMILEEESKIMHEVIMDLHWMARRYADGRKSYVTRTFNDMTRKLLKLGVRLDKCQEGMFARDAMGREFDGLTDDEYLYMEKIELEKSLNGRLCKNINSKQIAMNEICGAAVKLKRNGFFSDEDYKNDDVQNLLRWVHAMEVLREEDRCG